MPGKRITLAAVAGAHGVGGELRLKLFAEGVESLKPHKSVEGGGKAYALGAVRAGGQGAIVRLDGIASRDAAESLRGQLLTVDRSALPPLADGEYYHADVIGCECRSIDDQRIGVVVGIEDYGAGDILEVEREDGTRSLVPLREPAAVLQDDVIVIDLMFLA